MIRRARSRQVARMAKKNGKLVVAALLVAVVLVSLVAVVVQTLVNRNIGKPPPAAEAAPEEGRAAP